MGNEQDFLFGAAWYPEWEPEGAWLVDLERMRTAGLNTVRIAEFSWEHIEPKPGRFHFDLYDRVMDRCAEVGMHVVLGVDTVRPPTWLFHLYPDIAFRDQNGSAAPGTWPMHCFNHPGFKEASRRYINAFVPRYRESPALDFYQLDNEPAYHYRGSHREGESVYCYCDHCQRTFRVWLESRYPGGGAPRFPDPFPRPEVTGELLWLEWRRFHDETNIRRVEWIAREVKKHDELHPVTTNIMIGNQFGPSASRSAHDVYRMGRPLDVYAMDIYTDVRQDYQARDAMIYSIADRLGGVDGYHCLETQPTTMSVADGGWQTQDMGYRKHGDDRRLIPWGWRAIAFGARSLLYWVWRLQYPNVWALARPDGSLNEFAEQTSRLAREFRAAWPVINGSRLARSEVAIVHNRDTLHLAARQGLAEVPGEAVQGAFVGCWKRRILPDVLDDSQVLEKGLEGYRVVLAPYLLLMSSELAAALRRFVEDGGVLFWDARSGSYGEGPQGLKEYSGSSLWKLGMSEVPAEGFEDVAGYRTLHPFAEQKRPFAAETGLGEIPSGSGGTGYIWWDQVAPTATAQVLARFSDGDPALLRNGFGKGWFYTSTVDFFRALYHGSEGNERLLAAILSLADVTPWAKVEQVPPEAADSIEVVLRRKAGQTVMFVLNANPIAVSPRITASLAFSTAHDVIEDTDLSVEGNRALTLSLEPYQVKVLTLGS